MSGCGPDPPSGVEPNSRPMLPDVANETAANAADFHDNPADGDANDSTVGGDTQQGNDVDELAEALEGIPASTEDPAGEANGKVVFKRFNDFPFEIRCMIWLAAAHNAKPSSGIYHFTHDNIKLGPGPLYPNIARTVYRNLDKIGHDHPLAEPIHELLWWSHEGLWLMTFSPSEQVCTLTRDIRALFASCSEARTELMRCPKLSSSFDFHYRHELGLNFSKYGKCNLGTIRPFYYDTDWICLEESMYFVEPDATSETRCTPDIGRIQHLAFPYYNTRFGSYQRYTYRRDECIWDRLDSLESVGLHAPCFEISPTSGWEDQITTNERIFLRGFPRSMRGGNRGIYLYGSYHRTRGRFGLHKAMRSLENLVNDIRVLVGKASIRHSGAGSHFSYLNFCILLHSRFQTELDKMHFREDGSHLDDLYMDDLGSALMSNRLELLLAGS